MSDPIAKIERSNAKDKRQTPAPDGAMPASRSKKLKPIVVEYRWRCLWLPKTTWREWTRFGAYRTTEEAQTVIDNQVRKQPEFWEFRLRSQSVE